MLNKKIKQRVVSEKNKKQSYMVDEDLVWIKI